MKNVLRSDWENDELQQKLEREDTNNTTVTKEQSEISLNIKEDTKHQQIIDANYLKNRMLDEDIIWYDWIVDLYKKEWIIPQIQTAEAIDRLKRKKQLFEELTNNDITALTKLVDFIIFKGPSSTTLISVIKSLPDTKQGKLIAEIIVTDALLTTWKSMLNAD